MRGRLPLPPFPRANRRGKRPRRPAEACADVLPRVTTRGDSRCRQHPRRGQDPSLRTEALTGVRVPPRAGHARPLPRGGSETGVRVNPAGVSISPSVGRGAPTPPRPPAAANTPGGMNPSTTALAFPPWGEGGPAGPEEGQAPAAAHSRATRRGRRPRRPAEACADVLPRVTTRGDSRCRQHPRRGQDPSLRTEPLTGACVTPRAGHARPLPRNNPTHLYTT